MKREEEEIEYQLIYKPDDVGMRMRKRRRRCWQEGGVGVIGRKTEKNFADVEQQILAGRKEK